MKYDIEIEYGNCYLDEECDELQFGFITDSFFKALVHLIKVRKKYKIIKMKIIKEESL